MGTGQTTKVLQRLQNLETAALEQLDHALLEWHRTMLDEVDDVDWPGGGYFSSREVRQVEWQWASMGHLELRDESR